MLKDEKDINAVENIYNNYWLTKAGEKDATPESANKNAVSCRPAAHLTFHRADVIAETDAGCINKDDGEAAEVSIHREDVARGAWACSDNGALLTAEVIEQAALAYIRRPRDDHANATAQALTSPSICQMPGDCLVKLGGL